MSHLIEIHQLHQLELIFKTTKKKHVHNHVQNHVKNLVQNHVQTVFKTMFHTMFKTMLKTMFKAMFKTMFKTMFENKKDSYILKNKSFLKITDPKKTDFIVNEFLKTRQNIQ